MQIRVREYHERSAKQGWIEAEDLLADLSPELTEAIDAMNKEYQKIAARLKKVEAAVKGGA